VKEIPGLTMGLDPQTASWAFERTWKNGFSVSITLLIASYDEMKRRSKRRDESREEGMKGG